MKRLVVFVVALMVGVVACLFIAGDLQVLEWRPESRFLLVFISVLFAGLSASWP